MRPYAPGLYDQGTNLLHCLETGLRERAIVTACPTSELPSSAEELVRSFKQMLERETSGSFEHGLLLCTLGYVSQDDLCSDI